MTNVSPVDSFWAGDPASQDLLHCEQHGVPGIPPSGRDSFGFVAWLQQPEAA